MQSLKPILQQMAKEWEALVLGIAAFILLIMAGTAISRLLSPGDTTLPGGGSARLDAVFAENAFSFLVPDQTTPGLAENHAFFTVPPPSWRPPRRQVDRQPKPDKTTPDRDKPDKPDRPRNVQQTPPAKPPNQPPPEPPDRDFVTYRGFMSAPSGENLALLTHEHIPGRGNRTSRSAFIEPGQDILGLQVQEVSEQLLVLGSEDGESISLPKGKRTPLQASKDTD